MSFRPDFMLTAWCLLWRMHSQWTINDDQNGGRSGNWKRVPRFLKHFTFARDACRFYWPPSRSRETKPSVNLKVQTDVDIFFSLPRWKRWNGIVADWPEAKRRRFALWSQTEFVLSRGIPYSSLLNCSTVRLYLSAMSNVAREIISWITCGLLMPFVYYC